MKNVQFVDSNKVICDLYLKDNKVILDIQDTGKQIIFSLEKDEVREFLHELLRIKDIRNV